MIKLLSKITLVGILAAAVLGTPAIVSAQNTDKPATGASEGKSKAVPFHGKVASVDNSTKTITLDDKNKRTFQVTSETKIKKDNKPGTLEDVTAGENVSGSYKKGEDNKLILNSLYVGERAVAGKKKDKSEAPK